MATDWTVKDLEHWEARIAEKVSEFGLNCFPQEFEICDRNQMLGLMAYSGMPSHYPHWSFGKNYERTKTLYDYGMTGIPYEMVINSNPSIAYLMRDNSLCLQILTMAHVYGHNDFFRNNFTFKFSEPELVVQKFKSHATRMRRYIEDPSIGQAAVEEILDCAHALAFQCQRNLGIKRLGEKEAAARLLRNSMPPDDPFHKIHKRPEYVKPDLGKVPLEPDEDILLFVRDHNPRLAEWERDVLTIAHERTRYFLPQMETKIMNEGWACYWHRKIMNALNLPQDIHMEFLVRHNQVVRPIPGDLNPYHIGLALWDDIVRRTDEPEDAECDRQQPSEKTGEQRIFDIREVDRDVSFLRRFLTERNMRDLDLFEYETNKKGDAVISKVSDEENWRDVKNTLLASVGLGSVPVIRVIDADFGEMRELRLAHDFDGRELKESYAEQTLRHLYRLWGRKVSLESKQGGKDIVLSWNDGEFSRCCS